MPPKPLPNSVRFWKYVQTSDDCWMWTGARHWRGHGIFMLRLENGIRKHVQAHRFSYELIIGPIPKGKHLDHIECNNPPCVNPAHTIPVTLEENVMRGNSPAAINARKTHCKRGHLFDEQNIKWKAPLRGRNCRICLRQYDRDRRARRKLLSTPASGEPVRKP